MKIKHGVICRSGQKGWQAKLQDNYNGNFAAFENYCNVYGIHTRLGFKSVKGAWRVNPMIQGSTNPSDLRRIKE